MGAVDVTVVSRNINFYFALQNVVIKHLTPLEVGKENNRWVNT